MKKQIVMFITALLCLIAVTTPVLAVDSGNAFDATCTEPGSEQSAICASNDPSQGTDNPVSGPTGIILKAIHIIQIVAGAAGVIMVIIGGLEYVMSAGDSAKLNTAKNTILFAVIGLIITIVAQLIIVFVIRRL